MTIKASDLPSIGSPFQGGFYAGLFSLAGATHALVLAPKPLGHITDQRWGNYGELVEGANSFNDGLANTQAMAAAGSGLAQWALELDINGAAGWYIPSRDELELCYRSFKPTEEENYGWRSGENPSAVPPTHQYTEALPAQTSLAAFQEGGEQAFEDTSYWSSTQYSPDTAWIQYFGAGHQGYAPKDHARRAVAVRRFPVAP